MPRNSEGVSVPGEGCPNLINDATVWVDISGARDLKETFGAAEGDRKGNLRFILIEPVKIIAEVDGSSHPRGSRAQSSFRSAGTIASRLPELSEKIANCTLCGSSTQSHKCPLASPEVAQQLAKFDERGTHMEATEA